MNVLFWWPGEFPVSYSNSLVERLKLSFRKFYGRFRDLIQQYEVSLSQMINDILTLGHLKWLPNRLDLPPISWPWYRDWPSPNYEWLSWSVCNGCGIREGNAYPSGHLVPPPFFGLAYAPIVETSCCLFATFPLEYPRYILDFACKCEKDNQEKTVTKRKRWRYTQ